MSSSNTCIYIINNGRGFCNNRSYKLNLCEKHFEQYKSNNFKRNSFKIARRKFKDFFPLVSNNWIILGKIGKGGFGTVYDCEKKNIKKYRPSTIEMTPIKKFEPYDENNIKYCIKISNNRTIFFNEVGAYNIIENYGDLKFIFPKIIEYGRIFSKDYGTTSYYIILEKLQKLRNIDILRNSIVFLNILSKYNISHGDIKIDNIMQTENNQLKLIDIGLIQYFNSTVVKKYGTLKYMSLNLHNLVINKLNDLESFLFVVLDLISVLPWSNCTDIRVIESEKKVFKIKFLLKDKEILEKFKIKTYPGIYLLAKEIWTTPSRNINYEYLFLTSNFINKKLDVRNKYKYLCF